MIKTLKLDCILKERTKTGTFLTVSGFSIVYDVVSGVWDCMFPHRYRTALI